MTREESIAILDGFKHNPLFNEQHFEALDMAILALSELGTKANEAIKPYVELAHSVSAEGEYIKKEDIVKYIDNMPSELTEDGRRMVRQIRLKEFVADLPTYLFPKREKGEWIWNKPTNPISYCKCSACNSGCWEMEFNFCPNCGAKMKGGE